ncbi:Mitochondrial import inner membrane translocase subunit TIM50-like protein [Gossypium australe]|uniref:Mitochondrial import inner membrane translocase subunit TIM50-like protein n=1 Tax=Gossypium australe TaxID=47621 RepID=A0A5B6WXE6_9ROSI|nr:Mitochondrial import inner membrane translocase subunit TIM50-like protein [Gossypium australe]
MLISFDDTGEFKNRNNKVGSGGTDERDLSKLNRDPAKILYVSAHAFDSSLQPENCVPIKPYKLETDDTALLDLIPFLECKSMLLLFPLHVSFVQILCFLYSFVDYRTICFDLSTDVARNSPADIRQILQSYERKDIAKEFLERSKVYQR